MTDPDTAMRMIRKAQRDLLAASEVCEETPLRVRATRVADLKMKLASLLGSMEHHRSS